MQRTLEPAPHLSPRLIARSLEDLRTWRLPDDLDLAGLHRGVLKVLLATDALAKLELPLDLPVPAEDARVATQWSVVASLLAQAHGVLLGAPHRQRISRLHDSFPGHASQLERMRREAVQRLRRLRVRVDFVARGPDEVTQAPPPPPSMRSSLLQ
jgi:hypothetical protein